MEHTVVLASRLQAYLLRNLTFPTFVGPARAAVKRGREQIHVPEGPDVNGGKSCADPKVLDQELGDGGQQNMTPELAQQILEEQQEARECQYIVFTPYEEEEDYTFGPPRFVLASDGIQDCATLLMTYELSHRIKHLLNMQRQYAQNKQHARAMSFEISQFISKLDAEIRHRKYCIEHQESDIEAESVAAMQKEVEILEMLAIDKKGEREMLESNVELKARWVLEAAADVAELLDEVFVAAKLLDEQDEDDMAVEPFDFENEFRMFDQGLRRHMEEPEEAPLELHPTRDYYFHGPKTATPTPEEQAAQNLRTACWLAKDRVEEAQRQFDRKEGIRNQELQSNRKAWHIGEAALDVNETAFDMRWIIRNREITHELVEAEAVLKQARIAAREAGVEVFDDDAHHCFVDKSEDGRHGLGYDIKDEDLAEICATAKENPVIHAWMCEMPDVMSWEPPAAAEVDDWCYQEVQMSDSRSVVNDNTCCREHIDEWQRQCEVVAEEAQEFREAYVDMD